jgi:hypothetical protein
MAIITDASESSKTEVATTRAPRVGSRFNEIVADHRGEER